MKQHDINQLVALEANHAVSPWSFAMFQDELQLGSHCRILHEGDGRCIGYLIARLLLDEWHIMILAIAPSYRCRGGAKQLIKELMLRAASDDSRAVMLEVRVSNLAARKLYQDMGFNLLYTRKSYYRLGSGREDAIVMDYRSS